MVLGNGQLLAKGILNTTQKMQHLLVVKRIKNEKEYILSTDFLCFNN